MDYQKEYHTVEEQLFRERIKIARATGRLEAIIKYIEKLPLDDTITYLKETMKDLEGETK